jgi:drug/metabolite transporter (DMT)-like permease
MNPRASRLTSHASRPSPHAWRAPLALGLALFLWALSPPAIRVAVKWYAPGPLALLRCVAASLAFAALATARRIGPPARRDLGRVALVGLTSVVGYHLLVNTALVTVPSAVTSILTNTAPVFTALVAVLLLGERLRSRQWAGILASLGGIVVIASGQWREARLGAELLLPLGGALCWTASTALQKPIVGRIGPERVTIYSIWIGTLGFLPFLPALTGEIVRAPLGATLGVVFLGIGPLAAGYCLWAYALTRIDAAVASAAFYLIPVLVALLGWLWLHEAPSPQTCAGGAIVIAGVALVQARERRM